MISLYQAHVQRWTDCRRCSLHRHRQQVVFARGAVPADVVFVGEGPGDGEDSNGVPFIGPAGHLIDQIVEQAVSFFDGYTGPGRNQFRIAFYNLVGCIPTTSDGEKEHGGPEFDAIRACAPRLQEFINIAKPKLVVAVGKLAEDWLDQGYLHRSATLPRGCLLIAIVHPAALLRMNEAQRNLAAKRCVVQLKAAFEELHAAQGTATAVG